MPTSHDDELEIDGPQNPPCLREERLTKDHCGCTAHMKHDRNIDTRLGGSAAEQSAVSGIGLEVNLLLGNEVHNG